ncbi:bifunctional phosphopantothenoylcysteine decarboxylase/phosphopantothenate--cysteine ligase CoaBC [Pontibacter arcticus]|uniref:Bifunctional phosphopantothenoylcysteine decarboxylase/phosphopantothenate--cysteine ligase CoaBC n=1 Tax=Pontibacter arcticus TaxID=2080288 RepID=A0A364RD27_9BACT|nr:bifunctional phosphopantothenoylcysteine decarboxylase/phosphopantothenate--cysteine ligase CoaBC [Pontibacter arcticus]RAU82248.1 bifunctional phosphopantothenoylcysteine decarboxylase/phosphopantothenate--cysteine ligase CoaBC [Pontibacter arcticus]
MFSGKTILLTAGPTYEAIDPVRFIGNHSTGKMGFALAECFASQGAQVQLIAGPTNQQTKHENITVTAVTSADEMYAAAKQLAPAADVLVFAAAVADYKLKSVSAKKIKKSGNELTIELVKNVDIAAELGKVKKPGQFSVGFALETDNETENAQTKLRKKNFDMIVLNSLNDSGAGFKHDTNKITILEENATTAFDLKQKSEVAQDIVNLIWKRLHA